MNDLEMLKKALENEDIQCGKYNHFADSAESTEIQSLFYVFAQNEHLHAQLLKKEIKRLERGDKVAEMGKCKECGVYVEGDFVYCVQCANKILKQNNLKAD